MGRNNILEFLEKYKKLDELCKQILSSDRGVSGYIDEMGNDSRGHQMITGWERDYKQLKKMRWIRNRLVHETDSFEDNLVNIEDIEWLHTFYHRIMECTDPFSLLYQSENRNEKKGKQEKCLEGHFSMNKASLSQNGDLWDKDINLAGIILAGVILAGVILIGIIIFGIVLYFYRN